MKASMPPTALESETGLSACCFYLTFWYAPSSSTLCLSFVNFFGILESRIHAIWAKMGALDLGFAII
jgi:hypothetical protein